jgi:hypothetical protein
VVSMNATRQAMLAGCRGLPNDLQPYLPVDSFLIKDHFADDETEDALAIGRRSGRCAPDARQILAQCL